MKIKGENVSQTMSSITEFITYKFWFLHTLSCSSQWYISEEVIVFFAVPSKHSASYWVTSLLENADESFRAQVLTGPIKCCIVVCSGKSAFHFPPYSTTSVPLQSTPFFPTQAATGSSSGSPSWSMMLYCKVMRRDCL